MIVCTNNDVLMFLDENDEQVQECDSGMVETQIGDIFSQIEQIEQIDELFSKI